MFRNRGEKQTAKKEEYSAKERAENIARETMTGDLRDCILDFLKHEKNPLPWNLHGEAQQFETIEKVNKAVGYAVERAIKIMAAEGNKVINAKLDKITIKDGIQAILTLSQNAPDRHAIYDAQGSDIMIVIADDAPFVGEKAPVEVLPDQARMALDADRDNEDGAGMDEGDGA